MLQDAAIRASTRASNDLDLWIQTLREPRMLAIERPSSRCGCGIIHDRAYRPHMVSEPGHDYG